MKQDAKSIYRIYPSLKDTIARLARKHRAKSDTKNKSDNDLIKEALGRLSKELSADQTMHTVAEDMYWERLGSQVIFPESRKILDNLMSAKFQMESADGFTLPFESFVLAMPNDFKFEGIAIPSFLVTWSEGNSYVEQVFKPFQKQLMPNLEVERFAYKADAMLNIAYSEDTSLGITARIVVYKSDIPELIEAKSLDDFKAVCHKRGIWHPMSKMTDADYLIQLCGIRLITALGVYHLATEGKRLRHGFPQAEAPRFIGQVSKNILSPLTLSSPSLESHDSQGRAAHYRSWHFRQLRADRYYQGEYADMPHGSRYAFVSETMVGRKIDPFTQT